jgi:aralkylamine N-acetyltransferase
MQSGPDLIPMASLVLVHDPTPPQIDQILDLYRQAGWWTDADDDPTLVTRLVRGSHCFVTAVAHGRIVGMGRAISDGASDAYIQDVTVSADFRGKGIGSRIVADLVRRLRSDGLGWIGLVAERNSAPFYAPMGFSPMAGSLPMIWKDS